MKYVEYPSCYGQGQIVYHNCKLMPGDPPGTLRVIDESQPACAVWVHFQDGMDTHDTWYKRFMEEQKRVLGSERVG
jgi:hypothetical protein